MSLLEAPYLTEALPNGSASCHKIVAIPENRSNWRFWYELDGIHTQIHSSSTTYIAQDHNGSHDDLFYWFGLCINYHMSVTHYKRPYDAQMARNRSALGSVLMLGASIRDSTVVNYDSYIYYDFSWKCCMMEKWFSTPTSKKLFTGLLLIIEKSMLMSPIIRNPFYMLIMVFFFICLENIKQSAVVDRCVGSITIMTGCYVVSIFVIVERTVSRPPPGCVTMRGGNNRFIYHKPKYMGNIIFIYHKPKQITFMNQKQTVSP